MCTIPNTMLKIIFSIFIFFFVGSSIKAQKVTFHCKASEGFSDICLENNPTTDFDEMFNSTILNKISQRYSTTTHNLIKCSSVNKFIAVIDGQGKHYIFAPNKSYLEKLKNKDWKVTGEFLHAIAHLKIGDTSATPENELNAVIETANLLKLAGATYKEAILFLDYNDQRKKIIDIYRQIFEVNDFEASDSDYSNRARFQLSQRIYEYKPPVDYMKVYTGIKGFEN